ncbi:E3 ubiquitin-protein ligase RNF103 [Nematostella vectensis]|uniref:E3 ubiquitin-protein ligase RNF103 n=1 Tax=Nematostella vectensis TaxID=45351 RepID=UPI0020770A26|nr:E3 ubiquitin-protein ligase RNF103 [Nematostella vectensis]
MLTKLLLLLVYFFLIFLTTRFLELTASWFEAGCIASQLFDPLSLSVRKLKAILDQRGVSYNGVVEKSELADLVEVSGAVTDPESALTAQGSNDNEQNSDEFTFKGASHFFEEVEDTKAGSWLVEVIPENHIPLLRRKQWSLLKRKMRLFGIRTGSFKCGEDPWLCRKYKWNRPSLVLSMPKGNQPKGNVILQTYQAKPNVNSVLLWINSELSSKVIELDSTNTLNKILQSDRDPNYIYVVYHSTLTEPPMFLSSLSIKFTGRVKFVYCRSHLKHRKEDINFDGFKVPSLFVITPERRVLFGLKKGEIYDYSSLELYLRTLHPEVNDLFLAALVITNLCCMLESFLIHGGILRRTFRLLCMLTFYNTSLIMLCLPMVWLFQLPFLQPVLDFTLKCCRCIMSGDIASLLRHDLMFWMNYDYFVLIGYFVFGFTLGYIRNKYKCYFGVGDDDLEDPNADWLTQDLNYFSRILQSLSHWQPQIHHTTSGFEDGFEMLVRRLAVPDLWLHPIIPTDYIKQLPTWNFCDKDGCLQSNPEHPELNATADCLPCSVGRPSWMIPCGECVICLDEFKPGCTLLGLPCGHSFHQHCIEVWLAGDNTAPHHCCPNCRWPAYRAKFHVH